MAADLRLKLMTLRQLSHKPLSLRTYQSLLPQHTVTRVASVLLFICLFLSSEDSFSFLLLSLLHLKGRYYILSFNSTHFVMRIFKLFILPYCQNWKCTGFINLKVPFVICRRIHVQNLFFPYSFLFSKNIGIFQEKLEDFSEIFVCFLISGFNF